MYKCEICDLEYSSRMGYYKHNKQYHENKIGKIGRKKIEDKTFCCAFCNKEFNYNQNKWFHEKKCKQNNETSNDFKQMKNEIEMLKKKIETLESKPVSNITNNNTNNNSINNTINNSINNLTIVFPFGKEPLNCIPESEIIKTLEECGINAITELCKKKHFNPKLPQLHNFCVTAKNDPYAIIIDPETKRTKTVNKKEVFDKAYYGIVMNIDSIQSPKPELEKTKNKIKEISMSKPMLKHMRTAINEEAYHNKNMIQNTWKNASFEIKKEPKTRNQIIKELGDLLEEVKTSFDIVL